MLRHAVDSALTEGRGPTAVCDPLRSRVEAARAYAPAVRGHADGGALLADDDVDLVVVREQGIQADQVLRALQAGKHVVVEKPRCLTVEQADRQVAADLTLAVHQDPRWDADCLAVKAAVRGGWLGQVLHLGVLSGAPMSITPAGRRRNVAVMQAATASVAERGSPVCPPARRARA